MPESLIYICGTERWDPCRPLFCILGVYRGARMSLLFSGGSRKNEGSSRFSMLNFTPRVMNLLEEYAKTFGRLPMLSYQEQPLDKMKDRE